MNLVAGQHLFEIWHTSSTVKTSKNEVKRGCSKKFMWLQALLFCDLMEGCKVFCVKIFLADLLGSQYLF